MPEHPSFELVEEFRITSEVGEKVRLLLHACFPSSEFARTRTYLKQLPQRRLLAWKDDELIAHMAIEHRVIGTETGPAKILGVIDLCVAPEHRGHGLASKLLLQVEDLGRAHQIDFLVLFAEHERLYSNNGYRRATNRLSWLKIHEHKNFGIGEDVLEELMVKQLSERAWPTGRVDLLGYQF